MNVPVVLLALVLAARLLQDSQGRADAGRLDWVGVALLPPGLALIVFGLSEVESHGGISAPIAFGPILVGLVLLALFARHGWRAERPLVDVRLFARRCFRPAAIAITLAGAALFGSILVLALYYQVARGESALSTGLLLAPQGLGAAAVMPIAGRLTDAYAQLEPPEMPRATATMNALQRTGGSVGTALLAVVLTHELMSALASTPGAGSDALGSVPPALRARAAEPLASAFGSTFWWAVGISALAIVPSAVLAWRERGDRAVAAVAPPA